MRSAARPRDFQVQMSVFPALPQPNCICMFHLFTPITKLPSRHSEHAFSPSMCHANRLFGEVCFFLTVLETLCYLLTKVVFQLPGAFSTDLSADLRILGRIDLGTHQCNNPIHQIDCSGLQENSLAPSVLGCELSLYAAPALESRQPTHDIQLN